MELSSDSLGSFTINGEEQMYLWPILLVHPPFYISEALIIKKEGYHDYIVGIRNACISSNKIQEIFEIKRKDNNE